MLLSDKELVLFNEFTNNVKLLSRQVDILKQENKMLKEINKELRETVEILSKVGKGGNNAKEEEKRV